MLCNPLIKTIKVSSLFPSFTLFGIIPKVRIKTNISHSSLANEINIADPVARSFDFVARLVFRNVDYISGVYIAEFVALRVR